MLKDNDSELVDQFFQTTNYAVLKLAIEDPELKEIYKSHVAKHNAELERDSFPNAGFDLFVPNETVFTTDFKTVFMDLKVKAEMLYYDNTLLFPIVESEDGEETQAECVGGFYTDSYYLYARSSFSKTPLMLSNHVGIIDSGYRGNLIAAVRKLPSDEPEYTVEAGTRLFQICHASLCPVYVVLVSESELKQSERGTGGFGSTGK
jgi:dUTP pyrophosphatase